MGAQTRDEVPRRHVAMMRGWAVGLDCEESMKQSMRGHPHTIHHHHLCISKLGVGRERESLYTELRAFIGAGAYVPRTIEFSERRVTEDMHGWVERI